MPETARLSLDLRGFVRRRLQTNFDFRAHGASLAAMFTKEHLRADLVAAATVACVALPLSLAIALASDVPPAVGLTTAVVAGTVAALFASSPLSVTGPAAAMAVLVGQIVDRHGLAGLALVTLLAGGLQLLTGVFGLGRIARIIPTSVVHGFTAGIGWLLLIGQLPRALGLPAPDESHVFDVVSHVTTYLLHTNVSALLLALTVVVAAFGIPRFAPRAPAALLGVIVTTWAATALSLDVPRLGEVPASFSFPTLPSFAGLDLSALFGDGLVVFALASLESLLSASAVDRIARSEPHDPDQELFSQGLANLVGGFFGAIPATSVIARSALNVQAGARTRRSALLHALFLALAVLVAAPLLATIPIAALGGVLLAVGAKLAAPTALVEIAKKSKAEALTFVVTAAATVFFDLLVGIQAGCVAAAVVALLHLSRHRLRVLPSEGTAPHTVSVSGALTFLSAPRLDSLRQDLLALDGTKGIVFDVRNLDRLDVTAAEALARLVTDRVRADVAVALLGPSNEVCEELLALDDRATLSNVMAMGDDDVARLLGTRSRMEPRERLLDGVERFRETVREDLSPLLASLATSQRPHTLFLTCADSRLNPSLFTGTHPGELFIVRNIGALLAPHGSKTMNDEGAALEYALELLGVRHVIVCGHSGCGAMTALYQGGIPSHLGALRGWAEGAHAIAGDVRAHASVEDATRACVLRQLEHLRTYPVVARRLARGELTLSAWFYEVATAEVNEWQAALGRYEPFRRAE